MKSEIPAIARLVMAFNNYFSKLSGLAKGLCIMRIAETVKEKRATPPALNDVRINRDETICKIPIKFIIETECYSIDWGISACSTKLLWDELNASCKPGI